MSKREIVFRIAVTAAGLWVIGITLRFIPKAKLSPDPLMQGLIIGLFLAVGVVVVLAFSGIAEWLMRRLIK